MFEIIISGKDTIRDDDVYLFLKDKDNGDDRLANLLENIEDLCVKGNYLMLSNAIRLFSECFALNACDKRNLKPLLHEYDSNMNLSGTLKEIFADDNTSSWKNINEYIRLLHSGSHFDIEESSGETRNDEISNKTIYHLLDIVTDMVKWYLDKCCNVKCNVKYDRNCLNTYYQRIYDEAYCEICETISNENNKSNNEYIEQIRNLEKRIKEANEQCKEAYEKYDKKEKEYKIYRNQVEIKANKDRKKIQSLVDQFKQEYSNTTQEKDDVIEKYLKTIDIKNEQIKELETEIGKKDRYIDSVDTDNERLAWKRDQLKEEIARLEEENLNIKQKATSKYKNLVIKYNELVERHNKYVVTHNGLTKKADVVSKTNENVRQTKRSKQELKCHVLNTIILFNKIKAWATVRTITAFLSGKKIPQTITFGLSKYEGYGLYNPSDISIFDVDNILTELKNKKKIKQTDSRYVPYK